MEWHKSATFCSLLFTKEFICRNSLMVELGDSKSSGEGSNPSSGANINTSVNLLFFKKALGGAKK